MLSGRCFKISARTSSVFTPSASPSKLSSTRWRRAGSALALTSLIDAANLPSKRARIFAALYRAGYEGDVIIEHEDRDFEKTDELVKRGFLIARDVLRPYIK